MAPAQGPDVPGRQQAVAGGGAANTPARGRPARTPLKKRTIWTGNVGKKAKGEWKWGCPNHSYPAPNCTKCDDLLAKTPEKADKPDGHVRIALPQPPWQDLQAQQDIAAKKILDQEDVESAQKRLDTVMERARVVEDKRHFEARTPATQLALFGDATTQTPGVALGRAATVSTAPRGPGVHD